MIPDNHVHREPSRVDRELEHARRFTIELDVHPLPAGVAFPGASYLGRGWLHEIVGLLPAITDTPKPLPCSMFDCYLHPEMSVADLLACFESVSDQMRNHILGASPPADYEDCQKWQTFFHSLSQYISALLHGIPEDEHAALAFEVGSFLQRLGGLAETPTEILPEQEIPNPLVLQVLWFIVEASCRAMCDRRRRSEGLDTLAVATAVKALINKLWDFSFAPTAVDALDLSPDGIIAPSPRRLVVELWICVFNLANDGEFLRSYVPPGYTFWDMYLQVLLMKGFVAPNAPTTGVSNKIQEAVWKSVFSICVFSQFSNHGITSMVSRAPPSWQVIDAVLEHAPLSEDAAALEGMSGKVLRIRHNYVRLLISRCLWLNLQWHWSLCAPDAPKIFNRLVEIFKGRKYENLVDEPSEFPSFLRCNDLALLQEKRNSDTAFTLFLKLVVRAADDMRKGDHETGRRATLPPMLRKILSLIQPIGLVPFTKAQPPTQDQLSMLYNRFSVVAVAVFLDPASIQYRLSTTRRYVDFRGADEETRRACIRGAMHLAILFRHMDLPLTDILEWLDDMTNVFIDEYITENATRASSNLAPAQSGLMLGIQLILGCVRNIFLNPSMGPENARKKYPDPALLQGGK